MHSQILGEKGVFSKSSSAEFAKILEFRLPRLVKINMTYMSPTLNYIREELLLQAYNLGLEKTLLKIHSN